jgi:asparagine synthase (glutamine-hydrolysing)
MAVGLEVRVPLLDHRVVAFSAALPDALKYRHGRGKYLLRQVLARYLPGRLYDRPKMGFGVPIARWLRTDLRELMMDYLSPERLKREGRFDHRLVARTIDDHLTGRVNHHYRLWALLMWEMWCEQWLTP